MAKKRDVIRMREYRRQQDQADKPVDDQVDVGNLISGSSAEFASEEAKEFLKQAELLQADMNNALEKLNKKLSDRKRHIAELRKKAEEAEAKAKVEAEKATEEAEKATEAQRAAEVQKIKETSKDGSKRPGIAYGYWDSSIRDWRYVRSIYVADALTDGDVKKVPAWYIGDRTIPMTEKEEILKYFATA